MNARHGSALFGALIAGTLAWASHGPASAAPPVVPHTLPRAVPAASGSAAPQEPVLIIEANGQATLGDLRITAFNFRDEAYKDARNVTKHGPTCAIQVFVRNDESKNQKLRVHVGQSFDAGGKHFEVLAIADKRVTLRFR